MIEMNNTPNLYIYSVKSYTSYNSNKVIFVYNLKRALTVNEMVLFNGNYVAHYFKIYAFQFINIIIMSYCRVEKSIDNIL